MPLPLFLLSLHSASLPSFGSFSSTTFFPPFLPSSFPPFLPSSFLLSSLPPFLLFLSLSLTHTHTLPLPHPQRLLSLQVVCGVIQGVMTHGPKQFQVRRKKRWALAFGTSKGIAFGGLRWMRHPRYKRCYELGRLVSHRTQRMCFDDCGNSIVKVFIKQVDRRRAGSQAGGGMEDAGGSASTHCQTTKDGLMGKASHWNQNIKKKKNKKKT